MRLFISVQATEKMKTSLIGLLHEMKQQGIPGSYVPAANLHMTLVFIGEVSSAAEIREVMKQTPVESFRITPEGFVNLRNALCVGIKGNQKLKNYVGSLVKELKKRGIPCDDRKYQPHITLIRKFGGKQPENLSVPREEFQVRKISLMKSEDKNGKRVYTEIFSVPVS